MNEKEVELLETLLEKYFSSEFDFYRKAWGLVYGENSLEDKEPASLFIDVILEKHPYHEFLDRCESDMMDHIRHVFILKQEVSRFHGNE